MTALNQLSTLAETFSKGFLVRFSVLFLTILCLVGGASSVSDGFEDGNINEYSGSVSDYSVTTNNPFSGSYSLERPETSPSIQQIWNENAEVGSGKNVSAYVYDTSDGDNHVYGGPGIFNTDGAGYYIFLSDVTLGVYKIDSNQNVDTIDTSSGNFPTGNYYKTTISVDSSGNINAYAVDDNGDTVTVTGSDSTYNVLYPGIASSRDGFFDDLSWIPPNQPPQFNSTSHNECLIGQSCDYGTEVYDADGSVDYTNLTLEYGGSTVVVDEKRTGTTSPVWNDVFTPQTGNKWLNATLEVVDDKGAVTTTEINRYLENQPPSVSLSSSPSAWEKGDVVNVSASASDPDYSLQWLNVSVSGDGSQVNSTSFDLNTSSVTKNLTGFFEVSNTGNYSVSAVAEDSLAKSAETDLNQSVPDEYPPESSINISDGEVIAGDSLELSLSAVDDDSMVESVAYSVDGSDFNTVQGSSTSFTVSGFGSHTVEFNASDNRGNVESTESVSFELVDLDAEFSVSPTSVLEGENVSVDASNSTGNIESYEWDWTGEGSFEDTGVTSSHVYDSIGVYDIVLRVTDSSGATDTATRSVTVDADTESGNKSIVSGCPSTPFCINTSVSSSQVNYTLDGFGAGDSFDVSWRVNASGTEGSYETFALADSSNPNVGQAKSNNYSVLITDEVSNSAPTPDFSISPSSPVAGESITFDASSSSDSDGSISSYQWDWTGDGTFDSSGETSTHTYSSSGNYSVKLKVVDDDGASSTLTQTVTIGTSYDGDGGSGGDGSTDDGSSTIGGSDSDSTDATASLDNSSVQILSPYSQSRFQTESLVTINEGQSTTISVCNAEYTVEVSSVQSQKEADLLIQGEKGTYTEGQVLPSSCDVNFQDGAIYLSSVVNHGSGNGAISLSIRSVNPIDFSKAFYAYNYTIDQEGTVELLQKKTTENSYTVIDSFSTTSTVTDQLTTYNQSLDSAVYQVKARLTVNGSSTETRPVGFYTGTVPVIDILRPEDGKTIAKPLGQPQTSLTLDYRFDNENNVSVQTGTEYVGPNGKVFEGDLGEPEFVGQDDGLFVRTFKDLANFLFQWTDQITFGPDVTVLQNSSVPVTGTGQFTGSVNLVDNESGSFFNTTSVPITVNVEGYDTFNNESALDEYAGIRGDGNYTSSKTNKTNVQISNETNTTYYQSQLIMFDPNDEESFKVNVNDHTQDLKFDYVVNSTGIVNRSLFLVGPEQETEIKLNPYKTQYNVEINESRFNGTWSEGNYSVRGEVYYQNGTKISGQTVTPNYRFVLEKKGVLKSLFNRWFDPVIQGLTTVYDFTAERAGFLVSMVMIGGWFTGFKARNQDWIAKAGAVGWFMFLSWYGLIPSNVQVLVLGLAALIATIKIFRGDTSL